MREGENTMNVFENNTRSCRKLFYNCDGCLSCIAPFADDINEKKCIGGIGYCEFRINNDTGKADPEGVR